MDIKLRKFEKLTLEQKNDFYYALEDAYKNYDELRLMFSLK